MWDEKVIGRCKRKTYEVACGALPPWTNTTIPRYAMDKRRKAGSVRAVSLHRR